MQKDDTLYIGHMLDLSRKALEKASRWDRASYDQNEDIRLILAHLVQRIGEAANRVSADSRERNADIPWKQVVGVRNRIVHDYMDIDYDVIWEIVAHDLPLLVQALSRIVEDPPVG